MTHKFNRPSPLAPLPQPGEGKEPETGTRAKSLLKFAKQLRTEQTDAELKLWYHLRAGRCMNLKFKRQKPIGAYIADFACNKYKLIVECDGSQHGDVRDKQRDAWFVANNYTVLHFWNNHVLQQTESVLEQIRQTVLALSNKHASEPKE